MHTNKRPLTSIHINTPTKMIIVVVLDLNPDAIYHLCPLHLHFILVASAMMITRSNATTTTTSPEPIIRHHCSSPISHSHFFSHDDCLDTRGDCIFLAPG